jgi:hypothetical protein
MKDERDRNGLEEPKPNEGPFTAMEARLITVQTLFESGIKVSELADDISPWVKMALHHLEQGNSLTPEDLKKIYSAQNTQISPVE